MTWVGLPEHTKLSMTATKRELKKANLDIDELPLIKWGDKALERLRNQGIEVLLGDVIKITRKSTTGGVVEYFRKVVN